MMEESKTKNLSLIIFSILIYVAILAVLGLFQIFVFRTDISQIKTVDFWIELLAKSLMFFSAYVATAILRYTLMEDSEEEYVEIEESIKKNRGKLIGNDFREHIDGLDYENKKQAWKDKYRTKLANHSRRISRKKQQEITNLKEDEWSFWTRRYVKKERRYKEYLDDEWIKENLRFTKIKYPSITVAEVINGTLRSKTDASMLNRRHLSKQVYKKMFFVFLSIIMGAVWSIIVFQEIINPLSVIAQIIFTLVMVLVNVISGFIAGGSAHTSRTITATERLEIILNYIKNRNNVENNEE